MTELNQKAFDALWWRLERGERLGLHETCACRRKKRDRGRRPNAITFFGKLYVVCLRPGL